MQLQDRRQDWREQKASFNNQKAEYKQMKGASFTS